MNRIVFFTDFLRLIRVKNLFILGLMVYFARIFLIGPKNQWFTIITEPEIFYISISIMLVAAAGYIINDYYDIKIDMINKPDRVILNRHISRRVGLAWHLALNLMIVILCTLKLSLNVAIFVVFCSFLLWLYSNSLKRTAFWGNLCISFLAFSTFFMLSLFYQKNKEQVLLFGLFSFLATLIREIVKDMEDVKGDEMYGCRTLPIVWGIAKTKILIYFILILIIVLLTWSYWIVNLWLYSYFLLFSVVPFIVLGIKLYGADKKNDFSTLSVQIKIIMLLGIIGMILV